MGTHLPLLEKGAEPAISNFRPISIVAKRLDASRCHLVWRYASAQATVLYGDPAPSHKRGGAPSPIFGPCLLRPNVWMHQDAIRYGGMPQPRRLVLDGDPAPPSPKRGRSPQFSAHVYCGHEKIRKQPQGKNIMA